MVNEALDKCFGKFRPIDQNASHSLDTIRGWAAIAVIVSHAIQIFISPFYWSVFGASVLLGQISVMIFFALSGFLITKSITKNFSTGFDIADYAAARINRIYPPLILSIVFMLALSLMAPLVFASGSAQFIPGIIEIKGMELDGTSIMGALFFLNGIATPTPAANLPLWSLSCEVWYYILAGIIAAWRLRGVIVAAALAAGLCVLNRLLVLYGVVWLAGAVACLLHNHDVRPGRVAVGVGTGLMLAATTLSAIYFVQFDRLRSMAQILNKTLAVFNITAGLATAVGLHLLVNSRRKLAVGRQSADFSYTLYIAHFPMLLFLYGVAQPIAIATPVSAVLSAVISILLCLALAAIVGPRIEKVRLLPAKRRAQAAV